MTSIRNHWAWLLNEWLLQIFSSTCWSFGHLSIYFGFTVHITSGSLERWSVHNSTSKSFFKLLNILCLNKWHFSLYLVNKFHHSFFLSLLIKSWWSEEWNLGRHDQIISEIKILLLCIFLSRSTNLWVSWLIVSFYVFLNCHSCNLSFYLLNLKLKTLSFKKISG